MEIRPDDLTGEAVRALVAYHLEQMAAHSPPESVHALDVDRLRAPGVTVYAAWERERLLGVAALRRLEDGTAELKSMRTHPDHLRRGVAAALLEHLIGVARAAGATRLSLETGSGPAFDPALSLYRRRGFRSGEPFGGYAASAFNQFLHLTL